ncbi:lysine exporter LysO family protein [Sedimentibacter hydroxybenzoicus DSM 7310]|uniref:Lysine exporter LysO family protein n=1 Tax=Sedimentibacter hydroxybenzoicus DSM 7310 TaxID=1123245 RepID=A0A974BGQ6_SEDHY|nr:lysine exporter LysO family protein [Sedimentibacter hydroxybenzoicus]NYB72859.1 lysine exporter LysO family protein [Sedimentibacter hydroxybenzoicus DSM 7310]
MLPFVCLGIGIMLGVTIKNERFFIYSEKASTVALILLMLFIGLGIGLDKSISDNFIKIGINCVIIAFSAIAFSVFFTFIAEKTVLPLSKLSFALTESNAQLNDLNKEEQKKSNLVWVMPVSIISGLATGILLRPVIPVSYTDSFFTFALIVLYICVGISQGANKKVFSYFKLIGFKVILIPIAILLGSLIGGIVSGLILNLPLYISVTSSAGMSFYSLTGAYMTQQHGVETGTYGFIVNVMREFFTILTMPLLIKISPGAPIAGGAAGNMDTMLAPITKFVGINLSLVTLLTGVILTFIVPFLLPVISLFFQ